MINAPISNSTLNFCSPRVFRENLREQLSNCTVQKAAIA